jgi:hypothetical protein
VNEQNVSVYVLGFFVSWGILAITRAIFRWIGGLFTRVEVAPDPWENAVKTVTQPQRMPDGRWMAAELAWKPCDPPVDQTPFVVHDRAAPGHVVKTCKHCQPLKGYSGVSYRPTN